MRDTSIAAYDSLRDTGLLSRRQAEVMKAVHQHFHGRTFTRKQLASAMGWPINRITGRVLELIESNFLIEDGLICEDGRNVHALRVKPAQLELLAA